MYHPPFAVTQSSEATESHMAAPEQHSVLAGRSQRYIPMLLRRIFVALGFEHFQRLDQLLAGVAGLDDGVHETALGCDVRTSKAVAEFFDLLFSQFFTILSAIQFTLI